MAPAPTRSSTLISSLPHGRCAEDAATEAAVRLISETAHDLRSPLTAVRESIRLVSDGDLGPINDMQQSYLHSALDQCGCVEQMVGEMVQLERLRTGIPRIHRQAVPVAEIRRLVDDALRPWAAPRQIEVLWDGADDPELVVFADPSMLRRLLVNLATNAIRASVEGSFVLIRLARIHHGEVVCWSVVDRGRGISEKEMGRATERQVSYADGEGLGLAISRQLAALHFSPLKIRSRSGMGTEVSFETPALGPRNLASVWSRWRLGFRSDVADAMSSLTKSRKLVEQGGDRNIRLDPPVVAVSLSHEASRPRCEDTCAAGMVSLGGTVSRAAADQFDSVFQSLLQMFDLAYRVATRRWVWCLDADRETLQDRIESMSEQLRSQVVGIRMRWSRPKFLPLDPRRMPSQLCELFVRQSLVTPASPHGLDPNQLRLETTPLEPSAVAAARLDAELWRLTSGLRAQTQAFQHQAKALRPQIQ